MCRQRKIEFFDRAQAPETSSGYALAIGWRWIIHDNPRLITFHDSLLPRYRGFAPLPTALINGDAEVGVTALLASRKYDRGDIIAQRRLVLSYPVKVRQVIDSIAPLYAELVTEIARIICSGAPLPTSPQNESQASYPLCVTKTITALIGLKTLSQLNVLSMLLVTHT